VQVKESIKGAKIINYHSQFSVPSSSYTIDESAYAGAPDSNVVAPPNFDLCGVEKVTIIPHIHFDGSPFKFLLLINFWSLALLPFLSSICCLFMKEINTNKRLMSPISGIHLINEHH
jgi:hypothetical protein